MYGIKHVLKILGTAKLKLVGNVYSAFLFNFVRQKIGTEKVVKNIRRIVTICGQLPHTRFGLSFYNTM